MHKTVCITSLLLLLNACASTPKVDTSRSIPLQPVTVSQLPQRPSTLEAGDVIDIQRLDDDKSSRTTIRPDGSISYPNAGSIKLAGLTPESAAQRLEEKLAVRLQAPEVVINIVDSPGHRAFVGGDVNRQGSIDLKGGITLQQAIFLSGGINGSGDSQKVVLLRQASINSNYDMYLINLSDLLGGGKDQPYAIWLQRGDIVFVPRSGIGQLMQLVEHINKSIPFNPNVAAFYNLNPVKQTEQSVNQ